MHTTTIPIADTTMESSIDDDDDHLEDELLERRRDARRRRWQRRSHRRQHRRAKPQQQQQQQQARQIRRRHMAHQQRRTSAVDDDEMIEERWLEVYDEAMMSPTDRWKEEEQMNELEGVATLERFALIHDEVEPLPLVHARKASQEQAPRMPPAIADERDSTQWHDMEPMSMSPSFDSVFEPVWSNGDPSFNENIKALSSTPKNSSSSGNIPQTNKALGDRVL